MHVFVINYTNYTGTQTQIINKNSAQCHGNRHLYNFSVVTTAYTTVSRNITVALYKFRSSQLIDNRTINITVAAEITIIGTCDKEAGIAHCYSN
jgi:hypothetical protein